MVYDRIDNLKTYKGLFPLILGLDGFISRNNLAALDDGEHEIVGKDLLVRVMEYETVAEDASVYECHRDYLDLHLILKGREGISCLVNDKLSINREYNKEEDTILFEGNEGKKHHLIPGDFLLLFPHEAHLPGLSVNNVSEKVRKAVFKIRHP
ncbi:MAG: YhcH/YjgK/YiaL family protein [Bacteroidetes bacterium]|nr:YhcH/YjgK/YiaL family protein [Bacteroidota bacterium]